MAGPFVEGQVGLAGGIASEGRDGPPQGRDGPRCIAQGVPRPAEAE